MVNYGSTAALLLIATTSISTSSVIAGKQSSSSSRPIVEKKKKQLLLRNNNVQHYHHHRDINKVERKLDDRYGDPFGGMYPHSPGAASSGDDVEPTSLSNELSCPDIAKKDEDGYGAGCREEAGPVSCSSNGGCSSRSTGYRQCFVAADEDPPGTCVCIIPVPGEGTMCTANYGGGGRPCCYKGKYI